MEKFGKVIVKLRIPILILSFLLLIPSAIGYFNTRVNYDILYYLPSEIETMQGQDILMDDFNKGAYAMVVVQNMDTKSTDKLIKKVEGVEHVAQVISYTGIVGEDVPSEIVPSKFRKYFENDSTNTTLFAIFFDNTTSSDDTMNAITQIREQTEGQAFISGMSAVVTDTKNLSEKETPLYVLIAVVLVCIVLAIFMDSFLVPVFFMISIGMAIVYNLGSNIFLGEVSYITKALAAVLQLGVTLDYSIFLWHSYKEMKEQYPDDHKEAMAVAIGNTLTSVVGSSITTVAGFIALCFMSFTLGLDLGIVMAKGVIFGVIGCVTILPALILTFDRSLEKTMHREIMPSFDKLATFIVNHSWIFVIIFLVLLGPAIYGQNHTSVYYDLSDTLPDDLACSQANKKLEENFDMNSIYMILADTNMSTDTANEMLDKLSNVDGVQFALGLDTALKSGIEQLDAGLTELNGNNDALNTGAAQINGGLAQLNANNDTINDGISQINAGLVTLNGNNDTLNGGIGQLYNGFATLNANNPALRDGSSQLADGTSTLRSSSTTLADGVTQLNDGAITLKDGMAEFNASGIKAITSLVGDDADTAVDTIKEVIKLGKNYNSFLDKTDGKDSSVTFVYKMAELTK